MITGNPVPLKVTEITPDIWIDGDQIVSMEYEKKFVPQFGGWAGGTNITMLDGRKIYVADMRPIQIINILNKSRGPDGMGFDRGNPD